MASEQELADKYAPIVYLRNQREPCDKRGSPYAPMPVEFLFDIEAIVLRKHEGGRTTDEARSFNAADLYGKDERYFIDLPGNPKRPGCTYERDYLARAGEYPPVAYAHIAREEGHEGFALQYWLFYYFNDWNNKHEADWEMIQLTFDGPSPADALSQEPTAVGYSQHGGGEQAHWDAEKLSKEGTRPVSFVAAGANANMFEPNIILGRGENGTGFGCDDARRPSRRVALEARLVEEPQGSSSEYAWLAYDGRWGERAPWEFNGPTGPNDKRAWRQPFSWQDDLRPSSIIVPSNSRVGPNSVHLFCDAIWFLSSPFTLVFRIPGSVLIAVMLVGLSSVGFLATRTRYLPVEPDPLRRRRRFGQVLTTAAHLYGRHAALFIGLGLMMFIPAGLVETGVQWIVSSLTPVLDTASRFYSAELAAAGALVLATGTLASGIATWFVTTAIVAAIAQIDKEKNPAALKDWDIIDKLPALVVRRLQAFVIVLLLAISVVGIPWAIRNGVRWTFIEQAILLDGTPAGEARGESARFVDGRWWHTFFVLLALSILGFGLGPMLAFSLLLFSPASLSVINLVSSLVFALAVPFTAIAQTLLYFDLRAQRGD